MKHSITKISMLIAFAAGLTACGGGGGSTAKINAADDTATTLRDQTVTINVLGNDDSDASLTGTLTQPAHGTAVISNKQIVYTPDTNHTGTDSFTYEVTDPEGNKTTAKVTVTTSNAALTKYNGTWKGSCETIGTRSFKQTWKIDGAKLDNDVKVWRTNASCQSGTVTPVEIVAELLYNNEVAVANTCAGGKAQEVDVTYKSLKASGVTIRGEQNIKAILDSQGISNALPKYGLICKGNDGKLYGGLITADKDASTPAKRPTEMDTTNPLVP